MRSQIKEIITHECQIYAIAKCDKRSDYGDMIDELYDEKGTQINTTAKKGEFAEWRESLLSSFYRRINFAQMLRSEGNRDIIYPMVYSRMKYQISALMRQNSERTIDDELRLDRIKTTGRRSVAFKLSHDMYRDLYPHIINESKFIPSSKILESECRMLCGSKYPLKYPDLVERLEQKDNEFWAEMVDVVKNFVSLLFYKDGISCNRDEQMGDFIMGCIEVLQKQTDRGELVTKSSAEHLLHSIQTTCRNKLKEFFRRDSRNKSRFAIIDEKEWLKMEDDSNLNYGTMAENRFDALEELDLLDIDLQNNHEVSSAVVHLLLCRDSRFYKMLVGKKEGDVDILMWHNFDSMSYEQIAIKLYGEATEKNKAAIRQKSSRITDWLKARFIRLVEEYRKDLNMGVAY